MEKTQIIYRITNKKNNKSYIGQTNNPFNKRKTQHLHLLRNNKHKNKHLQNSFNKYGELNFEFIIIMNCTSQKELDEEEKRLILEKGYYNLKSGGNSNYQLSEDTKIKIGLGNKNKIISNEQKLNLSKQNIGIKHPRCKLTEKEVYFIKYVFKPKAKDLSKLSRIFNINRSVTSNIYNNKKWNHIKEELFDKNLIKIEFNNIINKLQ